MNRVTTLALGLGLRLGHTDHHAGTAPFMSRRFVAGFWTTMRPYLLFVSGITGLLGLALAPAAPAAPTALLALVFFLAYGFGQALTDCFQMDTDTLSAPYRPLVRGEISRTHVLLTSLAGLAVSGFVLVRFHLANLPLAGLEVMGLLTYTAMKRRWWAGPSHNAWIVALLVIMGTAAAAGAAGAAVVLDRKLLAAGTASFLAYAAFVIAGYHKDVEADRATGYVTLPVRFGRRVSAWTCDAFAAGAVIVSTVLVAMAPNLGRKNGAPALVFLAAGGITFLVAEVRLHRSRDDADAHPAIALVVHAYIFLLAAGAAAHRPQWWPLLLAFYLLFVLALRARPMREQI